MLNSENFLERSYLKSENLRWRFISVFLLIFVVAGFLYNKGYFDNNNKNEKDAIYRVFIKGLIVDDYDRNKSIELLAEKDNVKAVIVHIDSPGGTLSGGESIYNALIKVKEKKPVIAVLGGVAASGGYMAAVASDYIVAKKSTITGSIGVMLQSFEATDLMEKIGVKVKTFKVGKYKGLPSPFEKVTPEFSSKMSQALNDSYNIFIDIVSKNRPLNKEEVLKLADGSIYIGSRARELKLVDYIGNEEEALNLLTQKSGLGKELDVIDYNMVDSDSFIDVLLSKFFSNKNLSGSFGLEGILALWQPKLAINLK